MVRILLIVIYALTSATVGSLAGMMQSLPVGIASGFISFLLLCQIDGAVLRRRFARQQRKEIAGLKKSQRGGPEGIGRDPGTDGRRQQGMEARAHAQNKKIVSELQVLESLMKEFSSRISDKRASRRAAPSGCSGQSRPCRRARDA